MPQIFDKTIEKSSKGEDKPIQAFLKICLDLIHDYGALQKLDKMIDYYAKER